MYFTEWEEFLQISTEIFEQNPNATRYLTKYRHEDGVLVLKITNNHRVAKFKTNEAKYLKRFETLNLFMLEKFGERKFREKVLEVPKCKLFFFVYFFH
ncbi:Signal recognition particle protein [Lobulomyces angularis]|nr:Signal recognition particle protein [Lobulomyces angularis]